MRGSVDLSGRALLNVELKSQLTSDPTPISVWIDTGFTGELVLPKVVIERLKLRESGSIEAILADGSAIELSTYSCLIDWFGEWQPLEIIANNGEFPLLGVGMLLGKELRINYENLRLEILSTDNNYRP